MGLCQTVPRNLLEEPVVLYFTKQPLFIFTYKQNIPFILPKVLCLDTKAKYLINIAKNALFRWKKRNFFVHILNKLEFLIQPGNYFLIMAFILFINLWFSLKLLCNYWCSIWTALFSSFLLLSFLTIIWKLTNLLFPQKLLNTFLIF